MESVAESTLFALLRRQCLHWLQIEIVVQMKEVQVLSVDEQIEHVVALPADL